MDHSPVHLKPLIVLRPQGMWVAAPRYNTAIVSEMRGGPKLSQRSEVALAGNSISWGFLCEHKSTIFTAS
jgi:hypothetical protein